MYRKTATEGKGRGDRIADLQNHHQKPERMAIIETESEPKAPPMATESSETPELSDKATFKKSTFGRGRPKLVRERTLPYSPQSGPDKIPALDGITVPLTISGPRDRNRNTPGHTRC